MRLNFKRERSNFCFRKNGEVPISQRTRKYRNIHQYGCFSFFYNTIIKKRLRSFEGYVFLEHELESAPDLISLHLRNFKIKKVCLFFRNRHYDKIEIGLFF